MKKASDLEKLEQRILKRAQEIINKKGGFADKVNASNKLL